MKRFKTIILLALSLLLTPLAFGMTPADDDKLSKEETKAVIDDLNAKLREMYLRQDLCDTIKQTFEAKLTAGEFYDITPDQFAAKMKTVLRDISNDLHFHVGVYKERPRVEWGNKPRRPQNNKSLDTVRILDGNIGYIKWRSFIANDASFKEMDEAIEKLKDCKALVIDVSRNGGGDGRNGGYLNQFLYKDKDYQDLLLKRCAHEENWYRSEVPYNYQGGTNLFDMPLYVIIDSRTFSAAEYFAFITKEMKRGTILGEKTPGGGHPISSAIIRNKFQVYIPICEIRTKDGKDLEGQGVSPDVEFTSKDWIQEAIDYVNKNQ